MTTIPTTDVPIALAHILDWAEARDEFLVLRDGVPIARRRGSPPARHRGFRRRPGQRRH